MKKFIATVALLGMFSMAHAVDVGVSAVRDQSVDADGVRVTVGTGKIAGFNAGVELTNLRSGTSGYDQYALTGTRELTKVGPMAVSVKVGAGFVDRVAGEDGYALTAGLVADLPLSKTTSIVASAERRFGQERINDLSGNTFSVGLKHSF